MHFPNQLVPFWSRNTHSANLQIPQIHLHHHLLFTSTAYLSKPAALSSFMSYFPLYHHLHNLFHSTLLTNIFIPFSFPTATSSASLSSLHLAVLQNSHLLQNILFSWKFPIIFLSYLSFTKTFASSTTLLALLLSSLALWWGLQEFYHRKLWGS